MEWHFTILQPLASGTNRFSDAEILCCSVEQCLVCLWQANWCSVVVRRNDHKNEVLCASNNILSLADRIRKMVLCKWQQCHSGFRKFVFTQLWNEYEIGDRFRPCAISKLMQFDWILCNVWCECDAVNIRYSKRRNKQTYLRHEFTDSIALPRIDDGRCEKIVSLQKKSNDR